MNPLSCFSDKSPSSGRCQYEEIFIINTSILYIYIYIYIYIYAVLKIYNSWYILLLLPLALQPAVGFGLSNNISPFVPIYHQISPSSHSQHLKISFHFFSPSFPRSSSSSRPFQFLSEDLFFSFPGCNTVCTFHVFFCGAATQRGSWPPHSWGFLDHTQRRTTIGRTPLNEWSARRRDLFLTAHDTYIPCS